MQQIINIDTFKENPQIFFNQLHRKLEKELDIFLQKLVIRYNVDIEYVATDSLGEDQLIKNENKLMNAFDFLRTGLPTDYKFNREEANER